MMGVSCAENAYVAVSGANGEDDEDDAAVKSGDSATWSEGALCIGTGGR